MRSLGVVRLKGENTGNWNISRLGKHMTNGSSMVIMEFDRVLYLAA